MAIDAMTAKRGQLVIWRKELHRIAHVNRFWRESEDGESWELVLGDVWVEGQKPKPMDLIEFARAARTPTPRWLKRWRAKR